ncbi:hypothetical protein [Thioclava sp. GXIMD4216]|uniref:hypothetical protein n=1 Tax=Thioclava sp. GXIMD4216 TaxID=3131929 RepID=UPI0030D2FD66
MPVAVGSSCARKVGLKAYRGKDRAPGFVLQAPGGLRVALTETFAALDRENPADAPHARRSLGPCLLLRLFAPEDFKAIQARFERLAPHWLEVSNPLRLCFVKIPSGLTGEDLHLAVALLTSDPGLCHLAANAAQCDRYGLRHGFDIMLRGDGDLSDREGVPVVDAEGLACLETFLSRPVPPALPLV